MTDPSRIVVIDGDEIRTSCEVLQELRDRTVQTEDGLALMSYGHRVIAMPHDELARLAAREPLLLAADVCSSVVSVIEARTDDMMMEVMEKLRSPDLDKAAVKPGYLPHGPSAKPNSPPPVRTGLREAARRRRQMEKRAAR